MKNILLVIAMTVLVSLSAFAQGDLATAEELGDQCRDVAAGNIRNLSPVRKMNVMYCLGYMKGLMEGTVTRDVLGKTFCVPTEGISPTQAAKVFMKYADEHPEKLHVSYNSFVITALSRAFPCDGQSIDLIAAEESIKEQK